MKLLFILFLIGIDGITVYVYSSKTLDRTEKQKTLYSKPLTITAVVVIILKACNIRNVYISNCTGYAVCYYRYYNYTASTCINISK